MRRFIPLNRQLGKGLYHALRFAAGCGAVLLFSGAITLSPSNNGSLRVDGADFAEQTSSTNPTDHFRSNGQDTWQTVAIWQSSPDSANWINATAAPTHMASSIVIRNSNTVRVNTGLSIDQLTILQGGILRHEAGVLTVLNGPGDDISIRDGGVLQFGGGSWPVYENSLARIRVESAGIVRVTNNVSSLSQNLAGNGSSGKIIYESGSIFEWNNNSAFSTSGQTYFPDAGPNDKPIFRITGAGVSIGANSTTTFNGVLEVNAPTTFNQIGNKVFRNGIIGSATLTQSASSGKFIISGDSAILGGVGLISLQASSGSNVIETGENTYLSLTTSKVINAGGNGKLIIKGTSTLDTRSFSFSGTAGVILEGDITYINAHPTGISGALGSSSGGINILEPRRQTYIFNRIGLQDSGSAFTTALTAGRFIITNGSKLNLSSGLFINNVADGFLKIEGIGSELRASESAETIEIVGSRSLILENGGTMHSSCLQFINLFTDFTDGIAVLNGNGQPIRCNALSSTKISGGGLTIAANTNLEIRTSLTVNYFATAVFTDNGNTISVGDDLQMTGSSGADQYNLTGTIIMTGAGAGNSTSSIRSQSSGVIHAELNNLVINSINGSSFPQFEPTAGGATIRIKGDFTIENCPVTSAVRPNGNTIQVGGNWTNIHENRFLQSTSTIVFDGDTEQTITCPGGEVFANMEIDKPVSDLVLSSNLRLTGEGEFTAGRIHTGDYMLEFGSGASAIDASATSYVNGRVRKTGFVADETFEFPVGDFVPGPDGRDVYQPASLETETSSTTASFEVTYVHENFNTIFDNPWNPTTAGIGSVSTCNYWIIDRLAGSLGAKVGLTWNEAQCLDVTVPQDLVVARYSSVAGDWSEAGSFTGATHTYSPSPQYATGSVKTMFTVDEFSPFTIGTIGAGNNVLPIGLLSFEAKTEGPSMVSTKWTTLSETNNDFFTVERSADAQNWESVGHLQGAGTSHSALDYLLYDDAPLPGRSYYRLKQTDFDGTSTYSEIETVHRSPAAQRGDLQVLRMPEGLEVIYANGKGAASIEIFELSGRRLFLEENVDFQDQRTRIFPNLSSGMYLLRIQDLGGASATKFFY